MWCLVSSFGDMWSQRGSQTGVELPVWLTLAVGLSWACLQQMMCSWNSDHGCNLLPRLISGSSMYGQSWRVCFFNFVDGYKGAE